MRYSLFIFWLTMFFLSCGKEEMVEPKLSSVDFKTETLFRSFKVVYDLGRIVQFGNSTYIYDANGRVEKEVYRISSDNLEYVSGAPISEVIFEYTWDAHGRLVSSHVISNSEFNLASLFYLQPFRRFIYSSDNPNVNRIEYYNADQVLLQSIEFYAKSGNRLDSIVTTSYKQAGPWFPPNTDLSTSNTEANIQIQSPNIFNTLFASLGFIPRDLNISYQNDVLLPYVILRAEAKSSTLSYDLTKGRNGRLESIKSLFSKNVDGLLIREELAEYIFNY